MADEAHRLEGRTVAVAGDKPERRTRFPAAVFRVAVRSSRRFGLGRLLGIVLLALFVLLRSWDPAPVETLRLRTFDLYQVLAPRQSATQAVVIVDLDEESLDAIGQWPWPRTIVAELVARVADYGSVAMAFDLVFAESDRMSPDVLAESLHGISEAARDELRGLPSNDQVFADVLRQNRVVLAQSGYQRDLARGRSRPISEIPIGTIGGDPRPFLIEFPGLVRNIPLLEDASLGDAMFTLLPERDGIVRRVPAVMTVDNVIIPSLALELLRVATGQDAFLIKVDEGGVRSVGVGGVEIPTDGNGRIWIHYTKHDPERYVSAKDVLSGTVAPERLAGKLVLIGTSATGLHDLKATPLDPAMPGVEVQAQLLETILTQSYLHRPSYAVGAEVILAILVGLVVVILVPLLRAMTTFLAGGAMALGLAALSGYFYVSQGTLVDVAYPLMSSFAVYLFLVSVNYLREETQRRKIRGAFGQYLSPVLVDELTRSPEKLVLGGEVREMTFLFCDVRGFTMISELFKADPQGLIRLMNRFLTPLTKAIVDRRGTIDKYMGDAIMAFWNAPLDDAEHASHACGSALAMLERLDQLNGVREREASQASQPFLPLRVGIGINTGDCVVGNLGSDLHFDYSVLGDSVNLASRLEGQSKTYGVSVIIGSKTVEYVSDRFALLELDFLKVLGKTEPDLIYTLLGGVSLAEDSTFRALKEKNGEMLRCYRAGNWEGALKALAACRTLDPGLGLDEFFNLYEERVRAFETNPPPADWNGVFEASLK